MEKGINTQSMRQKCSTYLHHPVSLLVLVFTLLAAVFTVGMLFFLVGYILIHGLPHLRPSLLNGIIPLKMYPCFPRLLIPLL